MRVQVATWLGDLSSNRVGGVGPRLAGVPSQGEILYRNKMSEKCQIVKLDASFVWMPLNYYYYDCVGLLNWTGCHEL